MSSVPQKAVNESPQFVSSPTSRLRSGTWRLKDGVAIIAAESWGEAVSAFHEECPDEQGGHVPIILVRALALHLRAENEADIRDAYKELGVDEFASLYDEEQRHGREAALKTFRQAVRRRLPA
jgi:hypothetical protein